MFGQKTAHPDRTSDGPFAFLNCWGDLSSVPLALKHRQQTVPRARSLPRRSGRLLLLAGLGRILCRFLARAKREAEQRLRKILQGWRQSRHAAERSFPTESHSIGNSKFCQKGGNVEFHGAFRHVQFAGNFLICATLKNAIQHFLLAAAYLNASSQGTAGR